MAIQNDFTIYPATKVIRHTSGTTTYTAVEFYSWLMNTFDEPGYLTYETPIRFNTPSSFTMINGWFLDNGDESDILQYIYEGGIDTSGYASVADPIWMMDMDRTTGADFVASDKDLTVYNTDDAANIGPLLAYKNSYPSAKLTRMWVRNTESATIPGAADGIEVTTALGTGDYTDNTLGPAIVGDEIYHNLYTIAAFAGTPDPQVYIYQNHPVSGTRTRIEEWSAFTNFDRGSIDVLIPVKLGGAFVDNGDISTFVRQTADTYTFVESTLDTSGRTPIATETSADEVNIAEGEHYMFYNGATSPTINAGDVIADAPISGGVPPTWYAEVVSHTAWDTATGVLVLRGLRGVPISPDDIYIVSTDTTANVNGSTTNAVGDTYVTYDAESTSPVAGDLDKVVAGDAGTASGAERILRSFQDDGTTGKLLLQVAHTHGVFDSQTYTGANRNQLYKDFLDDDQVTQPGAGSMAVTLNANSTTLISGFSDISVLHMNGTITTGAFSGGTGTFTLGERVTWGGGGEAYVIDYVLDTSLSVANVDSTDEPTTSDVIVGDISGTSATASGTMTDDNVEDYAFSLQTAYNYSVFIEGGTIYNAGRTLTDIYAYLQFYLRDGQSISDRIIYTSNGSAITEVAAEEYIKADSTYSATKPAPFGTLAGGVFFGAQGVWVQGMATADNNNIKFTDTGSNLRFPYTSIDLVISNTREDDRIAVYLEDGTTELPKKDQYQSHNTLNAQGDSTFDVIETYGTFPLDTPTSGTFIAVDTSANEEHRYRYTEYNGTGGDGDDGQLILPTEIAGTSTGGGTQQLIDSGNPFGAVQVGDIVRQTTDGGWGYVTNVVGVDELTMTLNSEGNTWAVKGYAINSLVVTYDNTDTFFIPYMDFIEVTGTDIAPGSQTVSVTYADANRDVVVEARNVENSDYEIVPFKTTNQITSTGMSQSVIRTEDTVYTP